ncbi:MAG TPA: acyltransferase family protein, partial [Dehalococcoidia bacterium]
MGDPSASSNGDTPVRGERDATIDVLRGLAILWVVIYHLWIDMKLVAAPPADYYHRFWDRLTAAEVSRLGTSLIDAISRIGFQGVPFFMMLSGLSLYIASSRRGRIDLPSFYVARFQRLIVPYWAAFGVFMLGVVGVAATRALLHDGSFAFYYHHGVTGGAYHVIDVDLGDALVHAALFTRLLSDDWWSAIPIPLWFVVILVQYY